METEHQKHLWEYEHKALFEVQLNHRADTRFNSWNEFIIDANGARRCNCMNDAPFLYWYWEGPDNSDEDEDVLNLIFGMFFSQITRFEIKVDRADEHEIRQWIREQQLKVAV